MQTSSSTKSEAALATVATAAPDGLRSFLEHPERGGKEAARYTAELTKLLCALERTPAADWPVQSSLLSQLARCVLEHKRVVGADVLADPQLLCRALWRTLNPTSVLGVQRKSLEFLSLYAKYADRDPNPPSGVAAESGASAAAASQERDDEGPATDVTSTLTRRQRGPPLFVPSYRAYGYASPLQHDYPYLLLGAMELLPASSMQLKTDLLDFMEQVARALSPLSLRTALYGFVSVVLPGLEETESSSLYRRTMLLLRSLRDLVCTDGDLLPTKPTGVGRLARQSSAEARRRFSGRELFYAVLWSILRDCPELRVAALIFIKSSLFEESESVLCASRSHDRRPSLVTPTHSRVDVAAKDDEDEKEEEEALHTGAQTPVNLPDAEADSVQEPTTRGTPSVSHSTPLPPDADTDVRDFAPDEDERLIERLTIRQREWLGGLDTDPAAQPPSAAAVATAGIGRHGLAHAALFACLQDGKERTQRLTMDLLLAFFPLAPVRVLHGSPLQSTPPLFHPRGSDADLSTSEGAEATRGGAGTQAVRANASCVALSGAFSFDAMALLVAACAQMLGLPGCSSNVLRRAAAWLSGVGPGDGRQERAGEDGPAHAADYAFGYVMSQALSSTHQWWADGPRARAAAQQQAHLAAVPPSASPLDIDVAAACEALFASALQTLCVDAASRERHRLIADRAAATSAARTGAAPTPTPPPPPTGRVGEGGEDGQEQRPRGLRYVAGSLHIPIFLGAGSSSSALHQAAASVRPRAGAAVAVIADWQLPLYLWVRALTRLLGYFSSTRQLACESAQAAADEDWQSSQSPLSTALGATDAGTDGGSSTPVPQPLGSPVSPAPDQTALHTQVASLLLPCLCRWLVQNAALTASAGAAGGEGDLTNSAMDLAVQGLLDVLPWGLLSAHKKEVLSMVRMVADRLQQCAASATATASAGDSPAAAVDGPQGTHAAFPRGGVAGANREFRWLNATAQLDAHFASLFHVTEVMELTPIVLAGRSDKEALLQLFHDTWDFSQQLAELGVVAAQSLADSLAQPPQGPQRAPPATPESPTASTAPTTPGRQRALVAVQLLNGLLQLLRLHVFDILTVLHERLRTSHELAGAPSPAVSDTTLADWIDARGLLQALVATADALTQLLMDHGTSSVMLAPSLLAPIAQLFEGWTALTLDLASTVGQLRWRERERLQEQGRRAAAEDVGADGLPCNPASTSALTTCDVPPEPLSPRSVERCERTYQHLAQWWRRVATVAALPCCPHAVTLFVVRRVLEVARRRAVPEVLRDVLSPNLSMAPSRVTEQRGGDVAAEATLSTAGRSEAMLRRLWQMLDDESDAPTVLEESTSGGGAQVGRTVPVTVVSSLICQLALTIGDRGEPFLDSLMMECSEANCRRIAAFFAAVMWTAETPKDAPSGSFNVATVTAELTTRYFTGYCTLLEALQGAPAHSGRHLVALTFLRRCSALDLLLPLLSAAADQRTAARERAGDSGVRRRGHERASPAPDKNSVRIGEGVGSLTRDGTKRLRAVRCESARASPSSARSGDADEHDEPADSELRYVALSAPELVRDIVALLELPEAGALLRSSALFTTAGDSALIQQLDVSNAAINATETGQGAARKATSNARASPRPVGTVSLLSIYASFLFSIARQSLLDVGDYGGVKAADVLGLCLSALRALNKMVALTQSDPVPLAGVRATWQHTATKAVELLQLVIPNIGKGSAATVSAAKEAQFLLLEHVQLCALYVNSTATTPSPAAAAAAATQDRSGKKSSAPPPTESPSRAGAGGCSSRTRHVLALQALSDTVKMSGSGRRRRDTSEAAQPPTPTSVGAEVKRSAPVALTMRSFYHCVEEGMIRCLADGVALRRWTNFIVSILPLLNKELAPATHHLLRALLRCEREACSRRKRSGCAPGAVAEDCLTAAVHLRQCAVAQRLCFETLQAIVAYLLAVAGVLDADAARVKAKERKEESSRWFSSVDPLDPSEFDANGVRRPLWERSAALMSARASLAAMSNSLIAVLAEESEVDSRAAVVCAADDGLRGAINAMRASAWELFMTLANEAESFFYESFVLRWGALFAPSEEFLRGQCLTEASARKAPGAPSRQASPSPSPTSSPPPPPAPAPAHANDKDGGVSVDVLRQYGMRFTRVAQPALDGAQSPLPRGTASSTSVSDAVYARRDEADRAERAALLLLFSTETHEETTPLHAVVSIVDKLLRHHQRDRNTRLPAGGSEAGGDAGAVAKPARSVAPGAGRPPAAGTGGGDRAPNALLGEPLADGGAQTPLTWETLFFCFLDVLLSAYAHGTRRRAGADRQASGDAATGLSLSSSAGHFTPVAVNGVMECIHHSYAASATSNSAAPGYLTMCVHLHIVRVLQCGPASPAARKLSQSSSAGYFTDKRFGVVLCRILQCLSSALNTSVDLVNHIFACRTIAVLLPRVVPSLAALESSSADVANQQRIVETALALFSQSLLPSIRHGVMSASEAEVVARTAPVLAALQLTGAIASLDERIMRPLRAELMQLLVSSPSAGGETLFHYPSSVLREWASLWRQFAQTANGSVERGFMRLAYEKLDITKVASGVLASLLTSTESEAQQRAHLLRCLAFQTLALPSAVVADAEYVRYLREQIGVALRSYGCAVVPDITSELLLKRQVQLAPVRAALLLFRVMLVREPTAPMLSGLWSMVVPEVVRALAAPPELTGVAREKEVRSSTPAASLPEAVLQEVQALQMEAIKLVDTAVTVCPRHFAPFQWVFLAGEGSGAPTQTSRRSAGDRELCFTPWLQQLLASRPNGQPPDAELRQVLADLPPRRVSSSTLSTGLEEETWMTSVLPDQLLEDVRANEASSARSLSVTTRLTWPQPGTRREGEWGGCLRPLLSVPGTHYKRLSGVWVCAAALQRHAALDGRWHGETDAETDGAAITGGSTVSSQVAAMRLRRNQLWDHAYARRLLETDMSLVDPDTGL